jgi:hypothetical protein
LRFLKFFSKAGGVSKTAVYAREGGKVKRGRRKTFPGHGGAVARRLRGLDKKSPAVYRLGMLGEELYELTDGKCAPRGDYLKRFFTSREGKKCLLYILANMGYFSAQPTDEARIVRNAAVALLDDIRERTGIGLDVNFVR